MLKQSPGMLGAILGYFGGLFWHMYLFSLISIWHNSDYHQYFFLTSCPHLQWFILEYFGTYFGILSLLFGNRSICSVKFCTDVLDVPFERHCTIFFPYRDPAGEPQGSIFRLILGNVYLILHNCSIFSHETWHRCSWYNPNGHYTQNLFTSCRPSAGVHFKVFWDLLLHMYIFFLDILSIFCHEILHRCSWYNLDHH